MGVKLGSSLKVAKLEINISVAVSLQSWVRTAPQASLLFPTHCPTSPTDLFHLLQVSSLFLTLPPIHLNGLLHNPHFSWHDGLLLYNILFSPQMASFFIFSPSLSYPHDPEMFVEFSALFETHRTSSLCQHHVGPHHQWEQLLV